MVLSLARLAGSPRQADVKTARNAVLPQQQHASTWATRISQYTKCGQGEKALKIYEELRDCGVRPNSYIFVAALKACTSLHDLEAGKQVHSHVVECGFKLDAFVGTTLVDFYVKCGSLVDARRVFEQISQRDVVCWNAIILGYAQLKEGEVALELYKRMRQEDVVPDDRTFVAALKACSSLAALNEGAETSRRKECLEQARAIQSHIVASGSGLTKFVGTMLVDVYGKFGSVVDARHTFDRMSRRDVVSWNALISAYAQAQKGAEALNLYAQMQQEGFLPDDRTFVFALKACASILSGKERNRADAILVKKQCLEQVRALHLDSVKSGFASDVFVGNVLVDVYARCGSLADARAVFENMPRRNVVSWTAIILAYAQIDDGAQALQLYGRMQTEGVVPSDRTFVGALKACSALAALEDGDNIDGFLVKRRCLEQVRAIHSHVVASRCEVDVFVGTMLVDVYARCGCLVDARHLFERMPRRDVVSWNAMILGYAQMEQGIEALALYARMKKEGVSPDNGTFVSALKACSRLAALDQESKKGRGVDNQWLEQVKSIHLEITSNSSQLCATVGSMLVDVYAKCGSLVDARRVFEMLPDRNVGSWNAMILAYAQMEQGEQALQLYTRMRQEGVAPDDRTFVSALRACSSLTASKEDTRADEMLVKSRCLVSLRSIHSDVVQGGYELDVFVGTMLVDGYGKCGNVAEARCIFERMPERDITSWNAMILAYAQAEEGDLGLELYDRLQLEGFIPNNRTFVGALKACSVVSGLDRGKRIHAQICKTEHYAHDAFVVSSLIDMYSKCGCTVEALKVFESVPTRDVVIWNALFAGYARQGNNKIVFSLFQRMREEGVQPDGMIFLSLMVACSHEGLVDKGQEYFEAMDVDYGISPTIDHYTCMIDLLGRAGQLDSAMQMTRMMPFEPDSAVWQTLLAACQKWRNVEIGREAFECAMSLDEDDAASYILMSNIYASAQMWEEAEKMQIHRLKTGTVKQPGQSWWTDISGAVHTFGVGDQEHSRSQRLYKRLGDIHDKLKEVDCGFLIHARLQVEPPYWTVAEEETMVAEVSSEKHLNNFTKLQICGSPSLETGNLSAHEGGQHGHHNIMF